MVLFLRGDYPITHAVLDKLNISARNAAGNQTIPNLVQLFDIIFEKNRENFEYLVSYKVELLRLYCYSMIISDNSGVADDLAGPAVFLS